MNKKEQLDAALNRLTEKKKETIERLRINPNSLRKEELEILATLVLVLKNDEHLNPEQINDFMTAFVTYIYEGHEEVLKITGGLS